MQELNDLNQIRQELRFLSTQDNLMDLHAKRSQWIEAVPENVLFQLEGAKQILKAADQDYKSLGIRSLCIATGTITWTVFDNVCLTPLMIQPVAYQKNLVTHQFTVEPCEDPFVNPFVYVILKEHFDLTLQEVYHLSDLIDALKAFGFLELEDTTTRLGLFHPHRFDVLRELDAIATIGPSELLTQLVTGTGQPVQEPLRLSPGMLYPCDSDQRKAIQLACSVTGSIIEGPPGTGKSQVITNILTQTIRQNKAALLCAEKRVALEVVKEKLEYMQLGDFAVLLTENHTAKALFASLKATWLSLEQPLEQQKKSPYLRENYVSQLQQRLDLLHHPSCFGGVSFRTFEALRANRKLDEVNINPKLPELSEFLSAQHALEQIYDAGLNQVYAAIQKGALTDPYVKEFKSTVGTLLDIWQALKDKEVHHLDQLYARIRLAASCQQWLNLHAKGLDHLLDRDGKGYKKFIRLHKSWKKLNPLLELAATQNSHWKHVPSPLEWEALRAASISSTLKSRLHRKKVWRRFTDLPYEHVSGALEALKNWHELQEKHTVIKVACCEMGLNHPETELDIVYNEIQHLNPEVFEEIRKCTLEVKQVLADENTRLNRSLHLTRSFLYLDPTQEVFPVLTKINLQLDEVLSNMDFLDSLPQAWRYAMGVYDSFEELLCAVLKLTWVNASRTFPMLNALTPDEMQHIANQVIAEEQQEGKHVALEIRAERATRFQAYHALLQTAPAKLTAADRALRLQLKRGKAILVKEFGKQRNHMPVRQVLQSDARIWIELMHPIWLTNPANLSRVFSIDHLVDMVIVDEASQVPWHHALGLIQRAKRLVIAGDEQQMAPTYYFKTASSALEQSLLDRAQYYLPRQALTFHYRSEHPDLIRFSNRYFYNGILRVVPHQTATQHPLSWIYLPDGKYEDRVNTQEAQAVIKQVVQALEGTDQIGVVAFSKQQVLHIRAAIPVHMQTTIDEAEESGRLFFKALEEVQGDECDHLIISMAYGKSPDGTFAMRFGPLNQSSGPKRLNVLFTRARKRMTCITSFRYADLKISHSEGVNTLRAWMQFLESVHESGSFKPSLDDFLSQLHCKRISDLYKHFTDAETYLDHFRLLHARGWV